MKVVKTINANHVLTQSVAKFAVKKEKHASRKMVFQSVVVLIKFVANFAAKTAVLIIPTVHRNVVLKEQRVMVVNAKCLVVVIIAMELSRSVFLNRR
jgi:hypothetical protein